MNFPLKLITLFAIVFCASLTLYAQEESSELRVYVPEGSRLADVVGDRMGFNAITISGYLTEPDFADIRAYCYNGCSKVDLSECNLPENTLPPGAFAFDTGKHPSRLIPFDGPKEVILPKNLEVIGYGAFWFCGIEELYIPETVHTIEHDAFFWSALGEIEIPASCVNLGDQLFTLCPFLERVVFPGSLKVIPKSMCHSCFELKEFEFQEGLEVIEEKAFYGSGLRNIILPEGLKEIKKNAFHRTSVSYNDGTIVIPSTIEKLGVRSFAMPYDSHVYCKATVVPECEIEHFSELDSDYGEFAYSTPFDAGWYVFEANKEFVKGKYTEFVDFFPFQQAIYVPVGTAESYAAEFGFRAFSDFIELADFPVSLKEVSVDSGDVEFGVNGNVLNLKSSSPVALPVEVYSVNGMMEFQGELAGDLAVELTPGLHIVRVAGMVRKISIR